MRWFNGDERTVRRIKATQDRNAAIRRKEDAIALRVDMENRLKERRNGVENQQVPDDRTMPDVREAAG